MDNFLYAGKTLLAQTVAEFLNVPFAMCDCTKMSASGYVGEDVLLSVKRLMKAAEYNLGRAQAGIIFLDEIDKIRHRSGYGRDVSGEGVQQVIFRTIFR